jgi:predicted dehydrogenase
MENTTRRAFARTAGWAAALSYGRIMGANDRVRMGFIGLGNRGDQVHQAFLEYGDAQTAAICDLRPDYLDFAAQRSRSTPKRYKEYKKLLEDKDIDAVMIATPDHWHALMFVDACNAGKDVYVEKPLSRTVMEGRKMVETAERTKRVVQVGTNHRSYKAYIEAAAFVRSGGIGRVTAARCFHLQNEWPNGLGNAPDEAPPDPWAWDQWLGPAPKVPYNRNRMFYNFRWFYDYSGGQVTNFGVHYIDVIRWCLGQDSPKSVVAMGGKYAGINDNREIPDTIQVMWEWGGPTLVTFEQYNANNAPASYPQAEIELRGTKGTLYFRGQGYEVVPQGLREDFTGYGEGKAYGNPLDRSMASGKPRKKAMEARSVPGPRGGEPSNTLEHVRNFLDCIKSRGKCNADILTGHLSTSSTLIGNIAHRTRSYLDWDGKTEKFTNNAAANKLLEYHYRAPYKLG